MNSGLCAGCGKQVTSYDMVQFGSEPEGYHELCTQCFNVTVATTLGMNSPENPQFAPASLVDHAGVRHTFHFQFRLLGTGVSLEAFELDDEGPSGHQFRIYGDSNGDSFTLFANLIAKIRRTLSIQHLVDGTHGTQIADHGIVRGQIECDPDCDDYSPLLVIDGRKVTLEEFGKMLSVYEGWRFKLVIREFDEDGSS